MAELIPENRRRLLLVEGQDDQVFFENFVSHLADTSDALLSLSEFHIIQYGGRAKLTLLLRELKKDDFFDDVSHIGIVRDSDFNTDAFRSVQDRLKTVNKEGSPHLPVPEQPLVWSGSAPAVSILIIPSAEREGMLDDFVMDALSIDPVANCVDSYFQCLTHQGVTVVPERAAKARVRVYLIGKNVDRATQVAGITERLFLSNVYETNLWQSHNLWDSPALQEAKSFLMQLLAN